MPHRKPPAKPGAEIAKLHEKAERTRRASDELIRQMTDLASQIQETKANAADAVAKTRRPRD